MATEAWNTNTKNNKCIAFKSEDESWQGPFFFVQGADTQLGLISRYLDKDEVVTWKKEIALTETLVNKINEMTPAPKFFIICGDLCDAVPIIDSLRVEQERDLKLVLSKLRKDVPILCVCGNHDVGDQPTNDAVAAYRSSFGDDYYSFIIGGILFIVINSQYLVDSSKVPNLAETHNKWLDDVLNSAKTKSIKRIIMFQHIPWFLSNPEDIKNYFTLSKEQNEKWLEKLYNAGVEAIFCGHYHRNAIGNYKGMPVITTTAVGAQLGNDKSGARIVKVTSRNNSSRDKPVEELENLKDILQKPLQQMTMKSSKTISFTDSNGHKTQHKETSGKVLNNGEVVAKITEKQDTIQDKGDAPKEHSETVIDVPSQGIHRTITNNEELVKRDEDSLDTYPNMADKITQAAMANYSPIDMAEYVFWTGDEKGVTSAIEEFLAEGIMSRDEAITFLESVKSNLDNIQAYYLKLRKTKNQISSRLAQQIGVHNIQENDQYIPNNYERDQDKLKNTDLRNVLLQVIGSSETKLKRVPKENNLEKNHIHVADLLFSTYNLDEVIYQLAKVMFTQSLIRGSKEAKHALEKFTTFLEKEAEQNHISRELEKKIFSVLLAALSDTLNEKPDLYFSATQGFTKPEEQRGLKVNHIDKHKVVSCRDLS